MNKQYLSYFLGVIFLSFFSSYSFGQAQTFPYWGDLEESSINIQGERQIIPDKYRVQQLDFELIKTVLKQAPMEFTPGYWAASVLINLPMPDGKMQQFKVIESPIMEPGLAAKFPEIRTFLGQGIDDPAANVRMDISHKGFHALIYSPNGTVYIDPYSSRTTSEYLVYYRKDFTNSGEPPFICGVDGNPDELPNISDPFGKVVPPPVQKHQATDFQIGDCKLRTYRLALAATGEYTAYHGGLVQNGLAAQIVTMNRCNGIYETDLGIRLILIANNNLIIYTNSTTDPYTNNDGSAMLTQNQNNLNSVIGTANYDIGHVFSTGGGGIAQLFSPCTTGKARGVTGLSAPVGDPFNVDYVIHEMGHQFGANHTQNNDCNRSSTACYEPGSASTAMGYAGICPTNVQNNSDPYYHAYSIQEIKAFTAGTGNNCATAPAYTNSAPVISSFTASQTIPQGTPFALTATATDVNGNALTYCWEQLDVQVSTQPPVSTATGGPNFRSVNPSVNPTRYFPNLATLASNTTPSPNWEVLSTVARSLNFKLVVRDNAPGGGCNAHQDITLTVAATGPFVVTAPNTNVSWAAGGTQTVTWSVASTDIAPVSCANVDILLSTDGGLTYPTTLATAVPNTGSAVVLLPDPPTTTARIMVRGNGRAFFDISNVNFTITSASCTAPTVNAPTLTQPTCALTTGTIVVNPAVAGVEYSINNGANWQISNTFAGLTPGAYNIRIRTTGSATCYRVYASNPVIVNAVRLAPVVTIPTVTQPTCSVPTGTIVVSANAGVNTLQYSVVAGTWQSSRTFAGLAANSYPIAVRLVADNTCVTNYSSNPVVINAALPVPVVNIPTVTQPTCAAPTGTIVVNATAGANVMQYSVVAGVWQSSATFAGLAASNYPVSVRLVADNTCVTNYSSNPVVINAALSAPVVNLPTVTQPTCAITTGTIVVNATAGANAMQYSVVAGTWQSSATFAGLAAGNYTISARLIADNNCVTNYSSNPVVINAALSAPVVNLPTVTQPTCAITTGTIVVNATAGANVMQYSVVAGVWQSSATFAGLAASNYPVSVRLVADNTCVTNYSSNPVVINAALSAPVVNLPTVTQPTCAITTGTIVVNATAGANVMQYSVVAGVWQSSATFAGLAASNYPVSVRLVADNTCVTNYSSNPVVINAALSAPVVNLPTVTQPTCAIPTGTIVVNATAGANVMQYSVVAGVWQNSATFAGLAASNYTIAARLAADNTCVTNYSSNPVVINAALSAPVVNLPTVTQPTCAAPTGTIVVNATAGANTMQYSVVAGVWQNSATFAGLAASNYIIAARLVADNTCVTNYSSNPVVINAALSAPVVNLPTVTQPTCAVLTGTIVVNATAGANTMQYSVVAGTWQSSATFAGLAAGNYTIAARLVADNTCVTNYSSNPVVINAALSAPVVNLPTVTQPTCAILTGTIVVNATAGANVMQYSVVAGTWQSSATFAGLAAGNYTIAAQLVADNTCVTNYSSNPVVINAALSAPVVNLPTVTQPTCAIPTGTIVVNATAGANVMQYSVVAGIWQNSATFAGLAASNYTIAAQLVADNTCVTNYSSNPVVINAALSAPVVNLPTVTQPTCAIPTGTIVVNATAGANVMQYSVVAGVWQNSAIFAGLAVSNYTIAARLVADNTCVTNYSSNPVVINAALSAPVVNLPTVTQPTCAIPTGTIVVNATAGANVMQYSVVAGTWQSSATFAGLAAGNHTIAARLIADNTCVTNYSSNPVVINAALSAPVVNLPTVTQPTCAIPTGTIVVNATAGANVMQYSVVAGVWQNSAIFAGLAVSNYTIAARLVADNTCVTNYSSNPVVINAAPPSPTLKMIIPSATSVCEGTPISIIAIGLLPNVSTTFNYTLDGLPDLVIGTPDAAGDYTFGPTTYAVGNHTFVLDAATVGGCTTNFTVDNSTTFTVESLVTCAPKLQAKAYFDGPFSTTTGWMNDGLRANNKLPLTQPYSTITFGGTNATAAYTGTEMTTAGVLAVTGSEAITDWVYIELRDAVDRSIVVAKRAALLQRDGDIVDMDGVSGVAFPGLPGGNYHVAIRHRLCLATRTQTPLSFAASSTTNLNFTNNSNALAGSLKPVVVGANTFYMMYIGDCSRDGFILSTDLNLIRSMLNTLPTGIDYFTRNLDMNFDAFILTSDLAILRQNLNKIQVNLNQ